MCTKTSLGETPVHLKMFFITRASAWCRAKLELPGALAGKAPGMSCPSLRSQGLVAFAYDIHVSGLVRRARVLCIWEATFFPSQASCGAGHCPPIHWVSQTALGELLNNFLKCAFIAGIKC